VVLHRLDRNVPALDRVAIFAGSAHLSAMDVGVAIGALAAYVGEYWLGVALHTSHVLVHAL